MRPVRFKYVLLALLILLIVFAVWRWLQGPKLAVYQVQAMPLIQTVVASGQVETVSRAQIGSEITGVVLERKVKEGDKVVPGDVLLVLKSDELAAQVRQVEIELKELSASKRPQAVVELNKAKVQYEQAKREAQRRKVLDEPGMLSVEEREKAIEAERVAKSNYEEAQLKANALAAGNIEELKLREKLAGLKAQLDKTVIRSEVSGTVLTRAVEPGDLVQPGKTLFTIALDGNTEIKVPLDERNLPRLALQQSAKVIADAYPDQVFPAKINFIAPSIDPQRGTVEVRLNVDSIPDFLRQDMTVSVNIETGKRDKALVVPNDAFSEVEGNKAEVVVVRDGKIQHQKITLGLRGLAMSEVLSGLKENDQVLVNAVLPLQDGDKVRVVMQEYPAMNSAVNSNSSNELPVKFD